MSLTSRACLACYGFAAIFTGLSARLVHLAVNKHEHYAEHARETYQGKVKLPARRGSILDASGAVLARNEPQKNVIADASLLVYEKKEGKKKTTVDIRQEVAEAIAEPLGMTAAEIVKKIKPGERYAVLKNKITEEEAEAIELGLRAYEKKRSEETKRQVDEIKGIYFEPNFERVYPEKQLLSHVVGFYGFEDKLDQNGKIIPGGEFRGIEGIERSMNDWLTGQDGWRCFEKDGRGREIVSYRSEERAPRNGANVQLTVDLGLQQILEAELQAACLKYKPIKASAIMMNPYTGEILSMANRPCFDPNEPGEAKPEQRFNHAVAGIYDPGSTMKPITVAGGLHYHKVTMETEIWCENGLWMYGGKPLRDHHAYGMLSVPQIVEKSSNIGAAKIAVSMGEELFHGWLRKFGFGQATGIALPGEARGLLNPRHQWDGITITRVAMGHSVSVTPLQLAAATSVVANGGKLMMPQILKRITDDSGKVLAEYGPQEVRQVLSAETAGWVNETMVRVTGKKGTASRAHIPGYLIAGKTGTTQKYHPVTGRPMTSKHVTSFVGYVPADKPAFCLVITLDEAQVPSNEDTGGMIVAPIFKAIAEKALPYMGIQPDPVLLQREKDAEKNLAKKQPIMKLEALAKAIKPVAVTGALDRDVTSICYDSRRASEGCLFVALSGERTDGSEYADAAVAKGAVAVVSEKPGLATRATHLQVGNARQALADLAAAYFRNPSHHLKMAGVTGTNGKTTTAFLIKHICDVAQLRCGLIGTVRYVVGDRELPATRTTPESADVHELLWMMRSAGCKSCAMEVSSHALVLERVRGVELDVAVFTNLTQDHLDFHKTMESYFDAKALLFERLAGQAKKHGKAVINLDDRFGARLIDRVGKAVDFFTYGQGVQAQFRASNVRMDFSGTKFGLDALGKSYLVKMPLIGAFNVYNSLAAIAAAHVMGVPVRTAVQALAEMPPVPGRMQAVPGRKPFRVFVDYAHTDDALTNALKTLRELEPARLIAVFGCGGNRDRAKRPKMAAAVDALADYAIITSDNPRREDPAAIIEDIKPGFRRLTPEVIVDRKEAIYKAIAMAQPRDIILLAGKGHETYQEFADATVPFDDAAIAASALGERRETIARPHPRPPREQREQRESREPREPREPREEPGEGRGGERTGRERSEDEAFD